MINELDYRIVYNHINYYHFQSSEIRQSNAAKLSQQQSQHELEVLNNTLQEKKRENEDLTLQLVEMKSSYKTLEGSNKDTLKLLAELKEVSYSPT